MNVEPSGQHGTGFPWAVGPVELTITIHGATELAIAIDRETDQQAGQALAFLTDRLIGDAPPLARRLLVAIRDAYFEAARRSWETLPPTHPERIREAEIAASHLEDVAEFRAEHEAHEAWRASAEGRAAEEEDDQLVAFKESRRPEEAALRAAWLEQEAQAFIRRRLEWEQERKDALLAAFYEGRSALPHQTQQHDSLGI